MPELLNVNKRQKKRSNTFELAARSARLCFDCLYLRLSYRHSFFWQGRSITARDRVMIHIQIDSSESIKIVNQFAVNRVTIHFVSRCLRIDSIRSFSISRSRSRLADWTGRISECGDDCKCESNAKKNWQFREEKTKKSGNIEQVVILEMIRPRWWWWFIKSENVIVNLMGHVGCWRRIDFDFDFDINFNFKFNFNFIRIQIDESKAFACV